MDTNVEQSFLTYQMLKWRKFGQYLTRIRHIFGFLLVASLRKIDPGSFRRGYSEAINVGTTISRVSNLDGERRICVNTVNCFHSCGLGGARERNLLISGRSPFRQSRHCPGAKCCASHNSQYILETLIFNKSMFHRHRNRNKPTY